MHNWIYEPGFPLLTVTQKNQSTVCVTQERFCRSENCNATQWFVPLSYTSGKSRDFSPTIKAWLKPNEVIYISHERDDWLIMNVQEMGYYRVNYDDTLWDNIIRALKTSEVRQTIHPLNRAQLVDDIFHIARIGKISYEKAFTLFQYFEEETSYYPWASAIRALSYLNENVDSSTENMLKNWQLKILTEAFPSNTSYLSHVDKLKEILIAEEICKLGSQKCLSNARKQFIDFRDKKILPEADKEHLIFCYGLAESDAIDTDYEFLLNVFEKSTSAHQKFVILSALGCMKNEELLTNYLNLTIIKNSPIREQDFATVFNSVYYNNKMGIGVALDFMDRNFKSMEIAYGSANMLSVLLLDIAQRVSSQREIKKVKQIIQSHKDSENIKLVESAVIEVINANQRWKFENGNEIRMILEKLGNNCQKAEINSILIFILIVVNFLYALI